MDDSLIRKIIDGREPQEALEAHVAGLKALRAAYPGKTAQEAYTARYGPVIGPHWFAHDRDALVELRKIAGRVGR